MKFRKQTERIALCGMLLSLMLILGYVESQIPIAVGVPGIKLGLSNGVLIFAVYMLSIPLAFLLMVLKVLLSAILFGGVGTIPYALAGGVLSLLSMSLLSRIRGVSPVVVSVVGGLMHNVGQVGMAMLILGTPMLWSYLAILMPVGMFTGAATGLAAVGVMHHLSSIHPKAPSKK
ncbi:MAG: Gx transporter family protein [Clostridia bacterium]